MINVKGIKSIFSIAADSEDKIMEKIEQVRFYNSRFDYYLVNIETELIKIENISEIRFRAWFAKVEKDIR